ncbi:hypothetical protein PALU110988_27315 [Paenibacillus lupini]|uniref:hypothetical protein n=1 Tax=Paenibacillus lupini TaxID=1450204 RepID=UPI001422B5C2|nr:hypothetical protein [Paenibacillus lupini]NIK24193.1 hypothetical protein [Paenibacillus lupini]
MDGKRRVYFDIDNGYVIEPIISTPAMYAEVEGDEVKEIYACYSQANIDRLGETWALGELLKDREAWTCYGWLRRSLVHHIMDTREKIQRDFETLLAPRYVYMPIRIPVPIRCRS